MPLESFPLLILIAAVAAGLGLLYFGGDFLLKGAVQLARRLNVSEMVIGLTVVSMITSMPELFTGLLAVLTDRPDLFMGNIVGSNLANIGLILGLSAIISPLSVPKALMQRELPILLGITILFVSLSALNGGLGPWDGVVLVVFFFLYLGMRVREQENLPPELKESIKEEVSVPGISMGKAVGLLLLGILLLNSGAWLLVEGASELAMRMGLSEKWIGLTVVAIGTSLPELAASIVGVIKGRFQLILGNIVGSNLINILFIAGITILVRPVEVSASWFTVEFVALILFTTILIAFCLTRDRVERWEGWVLLVLYGALIFGSKVN